MVAFSSKRGNVYRFVADNGEKLRLDAKLTYTLTGDKGTYLFTDYAGTIYNGWEMRDGKRFYTFASDVECDFFNTVLASIPEKHLVS